ncbi:MAG: hypothetical protein WC829_01670 [Hyphomicrobium sp.]|jgi:hypothetical protein
MSLEDALKENTEAVRDLAAAMNALLEKSNTPEKETKAPKSAPTAEDAPSPPTATAPVAPEPKAENSDTGAQSAATEQPDSTAADVTYQQVADTFLSVFKADREKGLAALKTFGVKKAPELKPEQYADFIAELRK